MSQRKRGPRTPAEVRAGTVEHAQAALATARAGTEQRANALHESLAIVQHARDMEASRGRSVALPEGAFVLQRLFIALLETLTPEQRAEVRRRLGE